MTVDYALDEGIATLTMDDGKANALSPAMIEALNAALDRATEDDAVVLLQGRPGLFSGGFDLDVLRGTDDDARLTMLRGGFQLAHRLLSHPRPVVMACHGHAVAMGLFLLCSGDYRVGASGDFRLVANEVALGLTIPRPALAVLRNRVTPSALNSAVNLSLPFNPADGQRIGLLDQVVDPDAVTATARAVAEAAKGLDRDAHAASKLLVRHATLAAIVEGIDLEYPLRAGLIAEDPSQDLA